MNFSLCELGEIEEACTLYDVDFVVVEVVNSKPPSGMTFQNSRRTFRMKNPRFSYIGRWP